MTKAQQHWAAMAESEPERLEAQANEWMRQHAAARVKEQMRLSLLVASARLYASDLRAMRAARQRLSYSHGC